MMGKRKRNRTKALMGNFAGEAVVRWLKQKRIPSRKGSVYEQFLEAIGEPVPATKSKAREAVKMIFLNPEDQRLCPELGHQAWLVERLLISPDWEFPYREKWLERAWKDRRILERIDVDVIRRHKKTPPG